ncbi:MAG: HD domain-containing protein [Bacteroidetes bacterium]|jgi:putative hydrolase of HD superfamily|nr:HD domain-containing protein [Bacteroidota bacterium]
MASSSVDLAGVLRFLQQAERLKNTMRTAFTSEGRQESVAEHTWRLCLMAVVLAPHYPDVDETRLLKMCIIHDLGEALQGDVPAPEQDDDEDKAAQERADLQHLLAPLSQTLQDEIIDLWDEYEAAATPEARLAKALDKLETILQHTQGQNPDDFDYRFNLTYGTQYTSADPLIAGLRQVLDEATERRAETQTSDG